MPNKKLTKTESDRIGDAPDHGSRIFSLERKLELLQHDHELSSYEEMKAIREQNKTLEQANRALADRVADLERRANIDHLSDSPVTYRDGIASVASLARVAIEGTRERRHLNERIAALEGEQS
jgi:hypothetical protein